MSKQKRRTGDILEIPIAGKGYSYAQVLRTGVAFFDVLLESKLENLESLSGSGVLFVLEIYDSVITDNEWRVVGNIPVREFLRTAPLQFVQDQMNPESVSLYDPNTGETRTASIDDCKGLERAAVWTAGQVQERILDYHEGKDNKWVEQLKLENS